MPMTPGLAPNLRLVNDEDAAIAPPDVIVEETEEHDAPVTDEQGDVIEIEHPDGSITISLDGQPIEKNTAAKDKSNWFRNLVEDIDPMELNIIADDLLKGINDDLDSRKEWIEDRAQGIKLLGLKIEIPGLAGASDGAPVEGMSKVRHPMLLEACLRFQANARAELLPVDGPVRIRNDSNNSTTLDDRLADALQLDMNHYLTATAKEYYPDTDRMLLMLGFGGTSFKKVYFCPLRSRPVSESVDADDLIVNNASTDLSDAKRITHRIMMRPSVVKRMQILGVYRDVTLNTPMPQKLDSVQREKMAQQGISPDSYNPDDRDREIYECYCELDIKGYEHKKNGKVTGLEIPYRVTIDASSREILSIVRNYNEDTKDLPEARKVFVKYSFVPGMGFYDIGLLHILGNATNAVTAAWRELLDAGMYNNFPGFLMADTGARQNTNIFRVPPGGGALVKTNGMPISQAVMALPYKEPSQALMGLVNNIVETGSRVGGTAEMQVAETRGDAPVGTIMAQMEQAQKVMSSVHKRLHASQAEEFALLIDCFKENPESFWQKNRRPAYPWDETTFMDAIDQYDLVPQADPNTASQTQRMMKIMALKQLQAANPAMYNARAIDMAAIQAMGWSNPEQFLLPDGQQPPPSPEAQAMQQQAQALQQQNQLKGQELQIKGQDAQTKAQLAEAQAKKINADADKAMAEAQKMLSPEAADPNEQYQKMFDAQAKALELDLKQQDLGIRKADIELDAANRAADRESRERVAMAKIIQDAIQNPIGLNAAEPLLKPDFVNKLENDG